MTTSTAELRRQRRQQEAHRAILDAAGSILVEDGYENFTMRKLAHRCGYAAPTIYHHFGDKKGLLDALLDEVFSTLVSQLERANRHSDPLQRMRVQFLEFVKFALRKPTHYRLLTTLREEHTDPPASAEQARQQLEEPLRALADSGQLLVADLEAVQQSFWALLHGLISLQTSRPDHAWSTSLVETSLEAMIAGFVRREAKPNARLLKPKENVA